MNEPFTFECIDADEEIESPAAYKEQIKRVDEFAEYVNNIKKQKWYDAVKHRYKNKE